MRSNKKIPIIIILSILISSCVIFIIVMQDSSNHADATNLVDKNNELNRVYNNEPLYIIFNDEYFTIQEGEHFDYFGAIKEINGDIDSINSIYIAYKKGKYEITYMVRRLGEEREYIKELIVK